MKDFLRRLKVTYSVYNFFHRKELYHNEALYKKLNLKKTYYSSVSSKDFSGLPDKAKENVKTDMQALESSRLYKKASATDKQSLSEFNEKGYSILQGYLSGKEVDEINSELELLLQQKKVKRLYNNKIMFAIHSSKLLRNIGNNEQLKEVLFALLGGNAILFQSINFMRGSEQASHSDSIHMTTYPLGGLLGVWIALEDITEDNGPLHYYPGSQKLPYYLNADYDNEGNSFLLGNKSYTEYEHMINGKIKTLNLKKEIFKAKKGDLLIWHANLFHGGEPHSDKTKTRKSMVLHYFKEGSVCYHEITQRPALIKQIR